jgi:hypothetical protein
MFIILPALLAATALLALNTVSREKERLAPVPVRVPVRNK